MAMIGGLFRDEGAEALQRSYDAGGIKEGDLPPTMAVLEELAPTPEGAGALVWRQRNSKAVNDILRNDFAYMVDGALARQYHPETYAEMAVQSAVSTRHNPLVDSVEAASRGIWPSAVWKLKADGEELPDDRFKNFISISKINAAIRRALSMSLVHPAVAVMPWVAHSKRTGRRHLVFQVLTPDTFDLKANRHAPAEWDSFCVFEKPNGTQQRMHEWEATKIETYVRRMAGTDEFEGSTEWRKVAEVPNRFGVVPVVVFRKSPGKLWSDHYGEKLKEATISINKAQTLLDHHAPTQVKLLAAQFQDGKFIRVRQAMGIDGGPNATPSVVDLQLNLTAYHETYVANPLREVAISMGLPPDEFDRNRIAPQSGESIRLKYAERQQRSLEIRGANMDAAVELYWVALQVLHAALENSVDEKGKPLPPIEGFQDIGSLPPYKPGASIREQPYAVSINVADLMLPRTQDERAKEQEYNTAHGFTTWDEELSEEQPDLPNPKEVIEANLRTNAATARMSARPSTTSPGGAAPQTPPRPITNPLAGKV